jgi:8-oxo-dGTP pyrophosphatase MutT (NUDIX family)
MDLISFLSLLTKLKENRLAGRVAHSLLAPPQRMAQLNSMSMTKMKPKKAAVLLLFYPNVRGEVNFVLTRRKVYKGAHSGQISFPGGKPKPLDDDLWATALRETHEEVGVASHQVKYIRSLTQLYLPPSNFLIVPYVGYLEKACVFSPDSEEVDAILEISLEGLINNQPVMTKQRTSSANSVEVPAYVFDQNEVWGATAMILSEFKMLFTTGLSK